MCPGLRENKSNFGTFSQWLCGISPSHSLAGLSHCLWFPPDVQHFYVSWPASRRIETCLSPNCTHSADKYEFSLVLSCPIVDAFVTLANMNPWTSRNCRVLLPFVGFFFRGAKEMINGVSATVEGCILFFSFFEKHPRQTFVFILIICCWFFC